jgi:hypothetical protein
MRNSVHAYFEPNLLNHFFGYILPHLTSLALIKKNNIIKLEGIDKVLSSSNSSQLHSGGATLLQTHDYKSDLITTEYNRVLRAGMNKHAKSISPRRGESTIFGHLPRQ